MKFLSALRTHALYDVFVFCGKEIFRQVYVRNVDILETVCGTAFCALKVNVTSMNSILAVADAVFHRSAAIFDIVEKILFFKQPERSENAASIHVWKILFNVFE